MNRTIRTATAAAAALALALTACAGNARVEPLAAATDAPTEAPTPTAAAPTPTTEPVAATPALFGFSGEEGDIVAVYLDYLEVRDRILAADDMPTTEEIQAVATGPARSNPVGDRILIEEHGQDYLGGVEADVRDVKIVGDRAILTDCLIDNSYRDASDDGAAATRWLVEVDLAKEDGTWKVFNFDLGPGKSGCAAEGAEDDLAAFINDYQNAFYLTLHDGNVERLAAYAEGDVLDILNEGSERFLSKGQLRDEATVLTHVTVIQEQVTASGEFTVYDGLACVDAEEDAVIVDADGIPTGTFDTAGDPSGFGFTASLSADSNEYRVFEQYVFKDGSPELEAACEGFNVG